MEQMRTDQKFDQAVGIFPIELRELLLSLPVQIKKQVYEIRIRNDLPLHLCLGGRQAFLTTEGGLTEHPPKGCVIIDRNTLAECFRSVCGYSVHAHQEDMKRGFITLSGGHRVGICGTCVSENGQISGVREISSLNIRIAREIYGAADELIHLLGEKPSGTLIAGVPGSGKTTVLRDLARRLSDGSLGRFYKITVIDERGEIAAMSGGAMQNHLGYSCDVLSGYPKGEAMLQAIRTLSPDLILCDEIGDKNDVDGLLASMYAGVAIIATVHSGSIEELFSRRQMLPLMETGAFSTLCFLGDSSRPGRVSSLYRAGEKDDQDHGNDLHYRGWRLCWTQGLTVPDPAGHPA